MDSMDTFLDSLGLWRKPLARDGLSLYRAVSEQLFLTQVCCMNVKNACDDYMERHRETLPSLWSDQAEITAMSHIYQNDFIIYAQPGQLPFNVTQNHYSDIVSLCLCDDQNYDSVYKKSFVKNAAICQSIVYEILYCGVFNCDDEVESAVRILREQRKTRRLRTDSCGSYCSDKDGYGSDRESERDPNIDPKVPYKPVSISPPLPYRIAKSLDPDIYRNVELDVWLESTKEQLSESGKVIFSPGDKCQVVLDCDTEHLLNAHIQEVDSVNEGPALVYIEELGVRHEVPYSSLHPIPGYTLAAELCHRRRLRRTRVSFGTSPNLLGPRCPNPHQITFRTRPLPRYPGYRYRGSGPRLRQLINSAGIPVRPRSPHHNSYRPRTKLVIETDFSKQYASPYTQTIRPYYPQIPNLISQMEACSLQSDCVAVPSTEPAYSTAMTQEAAGNTASSPVCYEATTAEQIPYPLTPVQSNVGGVDHDPHTYWVPRGGYVDTRGMMLNANMHPGECEYVNSDVPIVQANYNLNYTVHNVDQHTCATMPYNAPYTTYTPYPNNAPDTPMADPTSMRYFLNLGYEYYRSMTCMQDNQPPVVWTPVVYPVKPLQTSHGSGLYQQPDVVGTGQHVDNYPGQCRASTQCMADGFSDGVADCRDGYTSDNVTPNIGAVHCMVDDTSECSDKNSGEHAVSEDATVSTVCERLSKCSIVSKSHDSSASDKDSDNSSSESSETNTPTSMTDDSGGALSDSGCDSEISFTCELCLRDQANSDPCTLKCQCCDSFHKDKSTSPLHGDSGANKDEVCNESSDERGRGMDEDRSSKLEGRASDLDGTAREMQLDEDAGAPIVCSKGPNCADCQEIYKTKPTPPRRYYTWGPYKLIKPIRDIPPRFKLLLQSVKWEKRRCVGKTLMYNQAGNRKMAAQCPPSELMKQATRFNPQASSFHPACNQGAGLNPPPFPGQQNPVAMVPPSQSCVAVHHKTSGVGPIDNGHLVAGMNSVCNMSACRNVSNGNVACNCVQQNLVHGPTRYPLVSYPPRFENLPMSSMHANDPSTSTYACPDNVRMSNLPVSSHYYGSPSNYHPSDYHSNPGDGFSNIQTSSASTCSNAYPSVYDYCPCLDSNIPNSNPGEGSNHSSSIHTNTSVNSKYHGHSDISPQYILHGDGCYNSLHVNRAGYNNNSNSGNGGSSMGVVHYPAYPPPLVSYTYPATFTPYPAPMHDPGTMINQPSLQYVPAVPYSNNN